MERSLVAFPFTVVIFPCILAIFLLVDQLNHSEMNHCVHDWSMEDDSRPDDELVELLWQNGNVVMHSQTPRKTMNSISGIKQCQKPESAVKGGPMKNSANMVQEEAAPWLQYTIDDSLEREFCQEFLYELTTTGSTAMNKLKDIAEEGDKSAEHGTPEKGVTYSEFIFEHSNIPHFAENVMPHQTGFGASLPQTTTATADSAGERNFTHFSTTFKGPLKGHNIGVKSLGDQTQGEVGESSSMMTKESRICGSNQVHDLIHPSYANTAKLASAKGLEEDAATWLSRERTQTDVRETTITSSSGGSGCTIGRTGHHPSANTRTHKRKVRDADESELQSEEVEYESMETIRKPQRSSSARRRRAAEVHNLSERRRRDRINEKMKALQELIPHCNKSDKASMLDEAIEYLKSLQLQVQIMWMRSGLAPMMFPGVHQMGMGMGHHSSMAPFHFRGFR